jgi:lipoate-protein ligase B
VGGRKRREWRNDPFLGEYAQVNGRVTAVSVVWQLGVTEYSKAYQLQMELHRKRLNEEIPDTLLLTEHTPTITAGRSGKVRNILVERAELRRQGVALFFSDRGDDIAYHCPGQIVGYSIMHLKNRGKDIRRFVYDTEEAIIRTMLSFGIQADRHECRPGIWAEGNELAAIRLGIKRWITIHGFAINVAFDLSDCTRINPCRFLLHKITSMSHLLGRVVSVQEVMVRLATNFSQVFETSTAAHSDSLFLD